MTTDADKNLYVQDGQLYILPTLSSEDIPDLMDEGKTYKLPGCTGIDIAPPPPTTNTTAGNGGNSTTHAGNATTTAGGGAQNGGAQTTNGGQNTTGGGQNTNGGGTTNTNGGRTKRLLNLANLKRAAGGGTAGGGPSRNGNTSACSASTSSAHGTVVNPVMSARLTTKGAVGVTYGRVEVVAKIPRG
jgi:hypothetical protein